MFFNIFNTEKSQFCSRKLKFPTNIIKLFLYNYDGPICENNMRI
nr:MAG TPA: hypothetical protein [Caudoviricetes sp.]